MGKNFYKKSIYEKLPKFKKTIWVFENYKLEKIRSGKEKIFKDLDDFYKKSQITTISEIERFIGKL